MKKNVFGALMLLLSTFCFSQTLVGKYEVKGFQYEIHTDFAENYPNQTKKEIYKVSRLENDSIVQSVFIDKHVKNEMEEINADVQLLDDVFVFEKTHTSNGEKMYGVDRIFIGNNGKIYKNEERYYSPNKPDLTTYSAQFPGGRRGLENWISNHFETSDFELYVKEGESLVKFTVKFAIGEDGKISDIEVLGNDSAKARAIQIIQKMPDWFPAMEKGVKVKASYNLPIHLVLDY